jgi:hypothetical protein
LSNSTSPTHSVVEGQLLFIIMKHHPLALLILTALRSVLYNI